MTRAEWDMQPLELACQNSKPEPGFGQAMRTLSVCGWIALLAVATGAGIARPAQASEDSALAMPSGCMLAADPAKTSVAPVAEVPAFPPIQLDVRTPVEPTVIPGNGRQYLYYELHLHNYSDQPLPLRGVEVRDAATGVTLVNVNATALDDTLLSMGGVSMEGGRLGPGLSAVVFMCVAFPETVPPPARIAHRVRLESGFADGPDIDTHHSRLQTLGAPVAGNGWLAANSPSIESHHRIGLFVAGGLAQISRRYAIDWKIEKDGVDYSGDPLDPQAYYAYGKDVLAVADGVVVLAQDGFPDNVPRTAAGFQTALPSTMDNLAGNSVVLDIGGRQFAYYAHMKPDSVRVKVGQRLKRGEVIGQVGNSGDARWPHLHFQMSDAPHILASEGVPFVFERYWAKAADGRWVKREGEFPFGDIEVDFEHTAMTDAR